MATLGSAVLIGPSRKYRCKEIIGNSLRRKARRSNRDRLPKASTNEGEDSQFAAVVRSASNP